MTVINVVNHSTLVSNADVQSMTRACASQIKLHAAPAWGRVPIPVIYLSNQKDAQPGSWVIGIFDDAEQQGDLGWHTETEGDVIYGRVFAKPVFDNRGDALHKALSVASVLSHEVLETFIDPHCNLYADAGEDCVAVEIGDPVEDYSYAINHVTVSDFVFPAWFDGAASTGPFDYLGKVDEPFEIAKGGYAVVMKDGKVSQVYGERYPEWRKDSKKSDLARTARRIAG